jgi:hypothetical protein
MIRRARDDNIIRRVRFACWITEATTTHSEYVVLYAFPNQNYVKAPQYYVLSKVLVLVRFVKVISKSEVILIDTPVHCSFN